MSADHKKAWKCQECFCKIPKTGNTGTPIRQCTLQTNASKETKPTEINNVTLRNKTAKQSQINETLSSEDMSLLGDTISYVENQEFTRQTELTLQNLSEIISQKLKENNKHIISELQTTIQTEICKAISKLKEEVKKDTNTLYELNNQTKTEIQRINSKIQELTLENAKLKNEMQELSLKITAPSLNCKTENTENKIVLYGLDEYYEESEYDLHYRVTDIFREQLNIDITGYIEETYRIGKTSKFNRPLVIELLSKRMTKFILNNKQYLQGTRLAISEYLDEKSRKERNTMREEMMAARKKGLYAIIRNNQLIIEGQKNTRSTNHQENTRSPSDTLNQSTLNHANQSAWKFQNNQNHNFRKY